MIYNVLIGNADAHGKNYSLVYEGNQRRLAPLYDLVCTLAWPELSKAPAMKIGKCDSMETVRRAHWQKMAEESNLGWPGLRKRIVDLAQRTLKCMKNNNICSDSHDRGVAEHMAAIIEGRAMTLVRDLE